jgi:hypothetical protein
LIAAACCLAVAVLVIAPSAGRAQRCAEPHYRWSQKIDTTLRAIPPSDVEVKDILTSWQVPPIGGGSVFRCAQRIGRERGVYSVVGWLRRIDRKKDDGDWHLELTQRRDSRVGDCIVVEIPLPNLHPDFRQARANVEELLRPVRVDREGDLSKPLRIRVTGAAFYDGQHLDGNQLALPRGHGRCNSSARALWEIHPVYRVERP